MKALYSLGRSVALSRVLRDHRTALLPLGIVLAINVVILLVVVLPLSRRVAANEQRAQAAARAEADANAEFRQAEALREGKARATTDLDTFYRQVLPADVTAARRTVQTKVRMLAEQHDVDYERGASDIQEIRDSALERFTVSMTLSGNYDDIRALLYSLETAQEFVVIDHIVLAEGLDPNALALSLELSTYYRAPAAQGAALLSDSPGQALRREPDSRSGQANGR